MIRARRYPNGSRCCGTLFERCRANHVFSRTRSPPAGSRQCAWLSRLHNDFIDIAPAPAFTRLERPHDGVLGRMEMLGCVFVLGGIAAADMPAGPAQPQVYPTVAHLEAFLATARSRLHVSYLVNM